MLKGYNYLVKLEIDNQIKASNLRLFKPVKCWKLNDKRFLSKFSLIDLKIEIYSKKGPLKKGYLPK